MNTNIPGAPRLPKTDQAVKEELTRQVKELRGQAMIVRQKTSETAKEMVQYCQIQQSQDPLLNPKLLVNNPWAEKKACSIL